ncbi:MAG: ATP-binding cassette domain-containing protein [Alphaproteobacteria bacterium]
MMIPKIEVINLHKSFGDKKVLQGVSFKVMPGESLVVLGGSGSGKSVLLKCILGLIKPDMGAIKIDGENILNLSESERMKVLQKLGMLFQGSALFDSLPTWKNVAFQLLYNYKLPALRARTIARKKLESVGLGDEVLDLSPSELSGGMQKRVGLARAIATDPEILFFDEPTTGLDPVMCGTIDNLIKKSVTDLGATTITITHDIESAKFIADKMTMLKDGKLIWTGKASQLMACKNKYVQEFVNGHKHIRPIVKRKLRSA